MAVATASMIGTRSARFEELLRSIVYITARPQFLIGRAAMMNGVPVQNPSAVRFAVSIGPRTLTVGQRVRAGGRDGAQRPTDLFVTRLASYVPPDAGHRQVRCDVPTQDLGLMSSDELGNHPIGVHERQVSRTSSAAAMAQCRDAVPTTGSHCTVHDSRTQPTDMSASRVAGRAPVPNADHVALRARGRQRLFRT